MKLSLIIENIKKHEFFDFYVLLQAYHDNIFPNHTEIKQRLNFICDDILQDHLIQISRIIANRLIDIRHPETKQILDSYNITIDPTIYHLNGLDDLSLQQLVELITNLVGLNHHHGFTGETWHGLTNTIITLAKPQPTLVAKIETIDTLYNLLHHGGQVSDYMDESDWLEDALNIRDNANPAQLFALASPEVRSLLGRSAYSGYDRAPVSDLAKLYTAIRRVANRFDGVHVEAAADSLNITVKYHTLYLGKHPFIRSLRTKLHPKQQQLVDANVFTVSNLRSNAITVRETATYFEITANNTVNVKKPVNRYYNLAQDLCEAAAYAGDGGELRIGPGVVDIKPSYYHLNNRRISL